jgi:CBS domain-containing protein
MNAATILKDKGNDVVTVNPGATLLEAARLLTEHRIGCIVVVAQARAPVGILSERDIVRVIAGRGPDGLGLTVESAMSKPVHHCRLSDTIDQLMAEMTARRIRHIPVVEAGGLVGLVSIGDVVKLRIAEADMETEAMRNYISAR